MERKGFSHRAFELGGGDFKMQFTPTKLATIRSSPARVVGAVMEELISSKNWASKYWSVRKLFE